MKLLRSDQHLDNPTLSFTSLIVFLCDVWLMIRNGDSKNSYNSNHLLLRSYHFKTTIKEDVHPYILDKSQASPNGCSSNRESSFALSA